MQAQRAKDRRWCRFADTLCKKLRKYGYGYCSVLYAAVDDSGIPRV
jgi:hypothetical protein